MFLYDQKDDFAEIPKNYHGMLEEVQKTSDILQGFLSTDEKKTPDEMLKSLQDIKDRLDENKGCC